MILGLIASALLCQQRSGAAIADWVQVGVPPSSPPCGPARNRIPSEATLRRPLRHVHLAALEQQLDQWTLTCTADLDDYLTWPGVRRMLRRSCGGASCAQGRSAPPSPMR